MMGGVMTYASDGTELWVPMLPIAFDGMPFKCSAELRLALRHVDRMVYLTVDAIEKARESSKGVE